MNGERFHGAKHISTLCEKKESSSDTANEGEAADCIQHRFDPWSDRSVVRLSRTRVGYNHLQQFAFRSFFPSGENVGCFGVDCIHADD